MNGSYSQELTLYCCSDEFASWRTVLLNLLFQDPRNFPASYSNIRFQDSSAVSTQKTANGQKVLVLD
jgi:hypothetical protein